MTRARRWLVPALGLAMAGCTTVTSYYDRLVGSSTPVEKPAELVPLTPTATAKIVWQASVGNADSYMFTPAVARGSVYAAGAGGQVAAFDAVSGKSIWQSNARQGLSGGVGADGNVVVAGTSRGEVMALDNAGKLLWKVQLTGEVLAAPQVADGTVVVRTGDGRIYALDAADGKRKWVYQRQTPTLSVRNAAGVGISRGGVFAGFAGGRLVALALSNGAIGWEAAVAIPRGATELDRIADITSDPLVEDRQVCAVAYQGRVACFQISNGNSIWAREMSSVVGLTGDGRNIYVTDIRNAVHGLDKTSGASVWKQDKLAGRRVSAPTVVGPYVAVGDLQGYVHFLNRDNGAFAARIATDGSAISAQPFALGDGILVQTRNGGLYRISIQ